MRLHLLRQDGFVQEEERRAFRSPDREGWVETSSSRFTVALCQDTNSLRVRSIKTHPQKQIHRDFIQEDLRHHHPGKNLRFERREARKTISPSPLLPPLLPKERRILQESFVSKMLSQDRTLFDFLHFMEMTVRSNFFI